MLNQAQVTNNLGEEACVQQVQNSVLHTTNVHVDGTPLAHSLRVERSLVVVRGNVTQEVPGGIHEGVHGVRVTASLLATLRARNDSPLIGSGKRRLALRSQLLTAQVIGQQHRQLILRNQNLATILTVNHGDGGAPETLAGQQPVTQTVNDLTLTGAGSLNQLNSLSERLGLRQAGQLTGVDEHAVTSRCNTAGSRVLSTLNVQNLHDGQVELQGELEVALVVRGHSHNRAGTVVGEHVVRSPYGQLRAGQRVNRVAAGEHAGLLAVGGLAVNIAQCLNVFAVLFQGSLVLGCHDLLGERRIRSNHDEGCAVQGVRAGGEHGEGLSGLILGRLNLEAHLSALGAANPVALHEQNAVGPLALQLLHVVQQLLCVISNLEVPLVQRLLRHGSTATLTRTVHNLLVREHGLVLGAPVDHGVLTVRQALLVELLEQPLSPLVVLGIRGVQAAAPVSGNSVTLEGLSLSLNVLVRPLLGVSVVLNGCVLSGQAEGVPANRVQNIVAALFEVAGVHVTNSECLRVTHVKVTGGVREHIQHILAALGGVTGGLENLRFVPVGAPLGFHSAEVVRIFVAFGLYLSRHSDSLNKDRLIKT